MNRFDRAIALHEQALEVRSASLGPDHPHTRASMANLAVACLAAGRLDRAIPLAVRTLEAQRLRLGDNHPDTLMSMNNLALAYAAAGQYDRLVPFCEQAVNAQQSRLGEENLVTLTWMNNLAHVYERVGQRQRAIPIYERVVKARRAKLGDGHPETLIAQKDLAASYLDAGRYQDGRTMSRNLVEAVRRAQPRDDPLYCESLAALGSCLSHQQEHADALSVLREGLSIIEKIQPDDWTTPSYRSLLGEALVRQKSFAAAENLLLSSERELAERSSRIPPHQRQEILRRAVDRLVELYELWDKPAEAEKWRKRLPPARTKTQSSPTEDRPTAHGPDASPPRGP